MSARRGSGFYKARSSGSLKQAVARLVELCGGLDAAADAAGVARATMFRYTDDTDEHASRGMPVHTVRALEKHCGEPAVTEFLAAELGAVLLRLPPGALPDAWAADLAAVMKETAEAVQVLAADLADGRVDRPGAAIREIDEAMAVLAALRARLTAERDAEGGR